MKENIFEINKYINKIIWNMDRKEKIKLKILYGIQSNASPLKSELFHHTKSRNYSNLNQRTN